MTYETARDRVLLYGGEGDGIFFADTWGWDGATWTQVSALGPGPCTYAAMTYALDRTAFFGGFAFINNLQDPAVFGNTWEWDGKHWTHRQDFGPSPRWGHAMAYDSARQRLVLFGGLTVFNPDPDPLLANHLVRDTWEHAVAPAPAAPEQPGGPGVPQPGGPGTLESLVISPAALVLPGVAGGNQEPFQVICTLTLNSPVPETRVGQIVANLPGGLFQQFTIPPGILSVQTALVFLPNIPPGTYQVDAVLDGVTRSATLTITAGA